jgi:hypothetical protein
MKGKISRAKIVNGVWSRNVPWENNGVWRSDIFKSVLSDPRLQFARYVLTNGEAVLIPVTELRRVVQGGRDHYMGGKIWGPFDIDPQQSTIDGQKVQMEIVPPQGVR